MRRFKKNLAVSQVIHACDMLAQRISRGFYDDFLPPLLQSGLITNEEIHQTVHMLSSHVLRE